MMYDNVRKYSVRDERESSVVVLSILHEEF